MPLNPRPFHAAGHQRRPDGGPHGFRDWSRHVGGPAPAVAGSRGSRPELPGMDPAHPLLKVAAAAFVGYTLGRLLHRRPGPMPARAQSRPAAADRAPPPRDPRSGVRFR